MQLYGDDVVVTGGHGADDYGARKDNNDSGSRLTTDDSGLGVDSAQVHAELMRMATKKYKD